MGGAGARVASWSMMLEIVLYVQLRPDRVDYPTKCQMSPYRNIKVADKALPEHSKDRAERLSGFGGKPPMSSPVPKAQCIACQTYHEAN